MLEQTACTIEFQGGNEQSVFPIPFPFLDATHLAVVVRSNHAEEKQLFAGSDYTVNRQSDGYGELILLGDDLAAGDILSIERSVPLTQEIFFHNQGPNSPKASEEALDKLTMIAQQHDRAILRRLPVPRDEEACDFLEKLQDAASRTKTNEATLATLADTVSRKAETAHSHNETDISGLPQHLSAKADAADMTEKLARKAPLSHTHSLDSIDALSALLAERPTLARTEELLREKADATALAGYAEKNHAARHALGGADGLSPVAIGAMPLSPDDGKSYLATGNGWLEYIPTSGPGETGGTTDHAALANRNAPGQHPQSAIQNLESDLQRIRQTLEETANATSALAESKADMVQLPHMATQETAGLLSAVDKKKLDALHDDPAALATRYFVETSIASYKESALADAPADGKQYVRQDNAWTEIASASDGQSQAVGAYIGEIRLLPFRAAELPAGWHFCNGDRYPLSSPEGAALASLSASYRADWAIAAQGGTINLPNLFSNNSGYFLRPANNSTRMPGNIETDAIRNITGSALCQGGVTMGLISGAASNGGVVSGAFVKGESTMTMPNYAPGASHQLAFDASAAVPTADENRPKNIAMTPALYLGV